MWPINIWVFGGKSIKEWIKFILHDRNHPQITTENGNSFVLFAAISMDSICYARNQVFHQGMVPDAMDLARETLRRFEDHCQAWQASTTSL